MTYRRICKQTFQICHQSVIFAEQLCYLSLLLALTDLFIFEVWVWFFFLKNTKEFSLPFQGLRKFYLARIKLTNFYLPADKIYVLMSFWQ